jgi:hypothetical protein
MSHFNSNLKKDPFRVINNSYDIEEVYSATLEAVFTEKKGQYQFKIKGIEFIKQIYDSICKTSHQNKMEIYPFLKNIRDEKSFEIIENQSTLVALKAICFYHYKWIRNPKDWKKTSRNPYRQIESLIDFLFCKHSVPVFLYQVWYKPNNELGKKWFFHLAEGKSAKDLPGLYFGWTKKMAHEFINTEEELEPVEVVIKSISKIHGGTPRLFPYLYGSSRIKEGIINSKIVTAEFWAQFIEYFSKQGMFDLTHISHIADYVYNIKFDTSLGRKPEKPNFDIRKKNLQTLINEAEQWTEQLNRLARAAGMARRVQNNVESAKRQIQYLETSWAASHWAKNWSYTRKVKVAEKKYIEVKYKMVELCNGAQLLEEGRAMNHCVFSYVGSCKSGVCRIFSLRDFTTKSTALTIEVRGNIITQVRGKGNRSMTSEEKTVVSDWTSHAGCTLSKYY